MLLNKQIQPINQTISKLVLIFTPRKITLLKHTELVRSIVKRVAKDFAEFGKGLPMMMGRLGCKKL